MLFLQESTPDTSAYMIAGYAIAFTVMGIYLVSLVIRWRNLNQDLQTLESIQTESRSAAASKGTPPKKSAQKKRTGKKK